MFDAAEINNSLLQVLQLIGCTFASGSQLLMGELIGAYQVLLGNKYPKPLCSCQGSSIHIVALDSGFTTCWSPVTIIGNTNRVSVL